MAPASAADGTGGYHHGPLPLDDAGGLREYSVVYTDRAINSMSTTFQKVMNDLHGVLTRAYNAKRLVIIPGSGSFGMEAVARQLASGKKALVVRNGYFSYRWTDIFEQSGIPEEAVVVKAGPAEEGATPQFKPVAIEELTERIASEAPAVVFAPHVETSTGIVLPDGYIRQVAAAAREAGAVFVLDGVAAGMQWIDMADLGVDVYITAPQKGWTGPACAGLVLLGERGYDAVSATTSDSMVLNLKKWRDIMEAYLGGKFGYYTTMPTDALALFRDVAVETERYGFAKAKEGFLALGREIRAMMKSKGYKSVAAEGYEAPGVVVSYTADPDMFAKFKLNGLQTAAGVPFMLGEDESLGLVTPKQTFRIGLFGIDKVYDRATTLNRLAAALDKITEGKQEL